MDRLEAALERVVEGGAARVFRTRLQPAEIGRRLERAMAAGTVVTVGGVLAPNRFRAALNPADFASLAAASDALGAEFADWLEGVAAERGWDLLGPVTVDLAADPAISRRGLRVTAELAGEPGAEPLPRRLRQKAASPDGPLKLLIASGTQRGQELLAPRPTATVGRAPDNDVVLLDESVSRHHARIETGPTGARVIDLGSTNGTWRNGKRAAEAPLRPGDEVRFGAVVARVLPAGRR
jgi:hypothetical protein